MAATCFAGDLTMTSRMESLLEQVKSLTADEQAQLLAQLYDLVSPPDPEAVEQWIFCRKQCTCATSPL